MLCHGRQPFAFNELSDGLEMLQPWLT